MCTSFVVNKGKTLVGWNLDLLDMEYRVRIDNRGVCIEINDAREGWMPLFGGNDRGDFVGMPTCWPFDERSNPTENAYNVINLDIDLLAQNKTMEEIREIAEHEKTCSIPGLTFMSALSDKDGNVLYIIPGQGSLYYERPEYKVMTNFSLFKMDSEKHPWMGLDRYQTAERILKEASDDIDVKDCFEILKAVSQEVCPTVVSMVYDVSEKTIYWCENRRWEDIRKKDFREKTMKEMIGYCGLDCEQCDAYIATIRNDQKLRENTAKLWSELNQTEILPEMINCEGCRRDGIKTMFCDRLCGIRQCALKKGIETCGECPEMDSCQILSMITANNPEAVKRLKGEE